MKNLYKIKKIITILFIFIVNILTSCEKEERQKDYISLDKEALIIDQKGEGEIIELKSNRQWEITNIPEWLIIDIISGEYDSEINISAIKNEAKERRTASVIFTCGEISKTLLITQLCIMDLDPFIELEDLSSMSPWQSSYKIQLISNCPWIITNIPEWLTITPNSGDGSYEINIVTTENRDIQQRVASLTFTSGKLEKKLDITQMGLKEVIRTPSLPIFDFNKINWSIDYSIETKSRFVNTSFKEQIYLGNLLCYNAKSNIDMPLFTGYTFNPTTVKINDFTEKAYLPSLEEQWELARLATEQSDISDSLIINYGTVEFYDYKQLHAVGMINMGIKLDEIVSGTSFLEKEKTKKFGVIFSFKRILFSLEMDPPQKLIQEDLKDADIAKGVSYVSSVSYGQIGLLIIESDIDSRIVGKAIEKVIKNKSISEQEQNAINSSDISYVYYNTNNEPQVNKGGIEAVNAYKDAITEKNYNIYPIQFQLSNFTTHEISTISFSYEMPK